jgi:hypothetical protein
MKSQALQDLIKSIFNDEKSKAEFLSNPIRVLSRFNLTDAEKRAVLNTHAKLGLITSNSQQLEATLDPTIIWSSTPTP